MRQIVCSRRRLLLRRVARIEQDCPGGLYAAVTCGGGGGLFVDAAAVVVVVECRRLRPVRSRVLEGSRDAMKQSLRKKREIGPM